MRLWEGRLKTALLLAPLLYLLVAYSPSAFFFIFVAVGIAVAQFEFYSLFFRRRSSPSVLVGILLGFLVVFGFYDRASSGAFSTYPGGILALTVMSVLIYELFFHAEIQNSLAEASVILLGIFYVAWLLGYLVLLRGLSNGRLFVLFLFLTTWSGDAGAYYTGKILGKRKLYPTVSPNKTVEGALGGWIVSIMIAFVSKMVFLPMLSTTDAIRLGALLGVVGQVGDLVESIFKRSAGIKDSGSLIPSHGGLLDKIDSLTFNTPVLFYYLILIKGYGSFTLTV
jgi:phosphatidate cytidylyltransferase